MLRCVPPVPAISALAPAPAALLKAQFHGERKPFSPLRFTRSRAFLAAGAGFGVEDLAGLAQNKVLISAGLACTIGQLSKPFTSALNGSGIDLGAALRSGGMPSTHSAAVTAATTCLALERGFSDPIFGASAVFAALVMYDAQGVRREVGIHAKVLNRLIKQQVGSTVDPVSVVDVRRRSVAPLFSLSRKIKGYMPEDGTLPLSKRGKVSRASGRNAPRAADGDVSSEVDADIYSPLRESVGHTEIQVIVGALLGFVASVAIELTI